MKVLLSVSPSCVTATVEAIALMGECGTEGLVFWLGPVSTCEVEMAVLPAGDGVVFRPRGVQISAEWMDKLGRVCEESGLVILAGLHSHPWSAFHSEVDSEGFLHAPDFVSIVLPNYGATTLVKADSEWAVYVGLEGGDWRPTHWSSVVTLNSELSFTIRALSFEER